MQAEATKELFNQTISMQLLRECMWELGEEFDSYQNCINQSCYRRTHTSPWDEPRKLLCLTVCPSAPENAQLMIYGRRSRRMEHCRRTGHCLTPPSSAASRLTERCCRRATRTTAAMWRGHPTPVHRSAPV